MAEIGGFTENNSEIDRKKHNFPEKSELLQKKMNIYFQKMNI